MSLDVYLLAKDEGGNEINVYNANITHNLNHMARDAGIYYALWRPEEMNWWTAKDIIPILEQGLTELESKPEYFKQFDSPNKRGVYEGLVEFAKEYLEACRKYPSARIEISR